MMPSEPIHIVLIKGSVRPGNYTSKALRLVAEELEQQPRVRVTVVDTEDFALVPPGSATDNPGPAKLRELVAGATGVILSTPEYHGSFSSVIKMVIENLGFPSVLSGKPVGLLGVAAGQIGAIKSLEHLRSVCSHVGAIVLPGPVSVARVQQVFDEDGNCLNEKVEGQVKGLAATLIHYIQRNICPRVALEAMVRDS
jgi:chromate reductase